MSCILPRYKYALFDNLEQILKIKHYNPSVFSLIRILSKFHLGEDYLLGNVGFLCSDKFFPVVDNIDECHKTFLAIKLKYPEAKNEVQPSTLGFESRPKGCFFNLPNKILYWNPDENGKANQDDRQVCKAKGKIRIYQLNYTCL